MKIRRKSINTFILNLRLISTHVDTQMVRHNPNFKFVYLSHGYVIIIFDITVRFYIVFIMSTFHDRVFYSDANCTTEIYINIFTVLMRVANCLRCFQNGDINRLRRAKKAIR